MMLRQRRRFIQEDDPSIITIEGTEPVSQFWSLGIDLGNVNDSTAISVVEVFEAQEITYSQTKFEPVRGEVKRKTEASFIVRHLHRPRLGSGYPQIIEQTAAILEDLPGRPKPPIMTVDATGLGAVVVGRMRERGLNPIGLTITGGENASLSGWDWTCPKGILVGELRMALHRKLLKIARGFPERETLANELSAFTARLSPSGRATFAAVGTEHDDTVLSLALAVLAAKYRPMPARMVRVNWIER